MYSPLLHRSRCLHALLLCVPTTDFAQMEMRVVLSHVIHHFDVELTFVGPETLRLPEQY